MAFQVGGACYETGLQAAQVAASAQIGSFAQVGQAAYVVDASQVAEGSITYTLQPVGGGVPLVIQSAYTAQPCNLLTAADGASLAWMVVAAWAAAFGVMFLRKALIGETGGSYGNA